MGRALDRVGFLAGAALVLIAALFIYKGEYHYLLNRRGVAFFFLPLIVGLPLTGAIPLPRNARWLFLVYVAAALLAVYLYGLWSRVQLRADR